MTTVLKDVGSGFKRTAINENFNTIEDQLNNAVLLKDGSQQLEADLDFNSNRGINLMDGVFNSDAATVAQLNASSANTGSIATLREVQTGADLSGSVTTLTAVTYVVGANNLHVYRNGTFQTKGLDYGETSANSLTWLAGSIPNATDTLSFITNFATTNSTTNTAAITHVDLGVDVNLATYLQTLTGISRFEETHLGSAAAGQVFTLTNPYTVGNNSLEVRRNGLPQNSASSYVETSSTSITMVDSFHTTDTFTFIVFGVL